MGEFNVLAWLSDKAGLEVDVWWLSVLYALFVLAVILIMSLVARLRFKKIEDAIIPSSKITLQNVLEVVIEQLLRMMQGILGDRAERFLPIIGTIFIYLLFCNLLGLIPGFVSPTTVITTNLGCAIVVFVYYNYVGIKDLGLAGYLKNFLGPVIWLAPLFLCIEIITHLVRPISLSVRLYGNMMGDHLVLGAFSDLAPLIIPIFFIMLGVFISVVQAFVFAILSAVYIALATEH